MIQSKADYKYYLECDKKALRKTYNKPRIIHDVIWKFEILLRKCEYYQNCKSGIFWLIVKKFYKYKFLKFSQRLGFSIPLNVIGPGLYIAHYGSIVINEKARIGSYCRIHECTCIGADGIEGAPTIGDYVFIATGAKIIGKVKVADNVAIGANAVVVNDILEPGITVGGIPAVKISNNGSEKYISSKLS